jgi:protocatechuate 3,4-dioxygenase beta subunit
LSNYTEHDDDRPVGRILSRREVLALLGGAGATVFLAACGDTTTAATSAATTQVPATTIAAAPTTAGITPTGTTVAAPPTTGTTAATATTAAPTTGAATASAPASTTAASTSTTAAPAAVSSCVVRPEVTEGPYFKDEKINRSDIRSDTSSGTIKAGAPLSLTFMVYQANSSCAPLKGAMVDVWHCDAIGTYSDTTDANWGSTVGQNYLRGYQLTDDTGKASFTTIYPGWYNGRTIHIHFKIRTTGANGQAYEFTSQLFFDENLSNTVLTQAPYNTKKGTRSTTNANDSIYQSVGSQMILALSPNGTGYAGSFAVGLDLTDTEVGRSDSAGGAGGPGGMPPGGNNPGGNPPGGRGGPPPTSPTPQS